MADSPATGSRAATAQEIALIIRPDLPWHFERISSWDHEKADALNKADAILRAYKVTHRA